MSWQCHDISLMPLERRCAMESGAKGIMPLASQMVAISADPRSKSRVTRRSGRINVVIHQRGVHPPLSWNNIGDWCSPELLEQLSSTANALFSLGF